MRRQPSPRLLFCAGRPPRPHVVIGVSSSGQLAPNSTRFPHGMKALSDYVHHKGLKLGTCARPHDPLFC